MAGAEKPILSRGTVGSRSLTAPAPPLVSDWLSRRPPSAVIGRAGWWRGRVAEERTAEVLAVGPVFGAASRAYVWPALHPLANMIWSV